MQRKQLNCKRNFRHKKRELNLIGSAHVLGGALVGNTAGASRPCGVRNAAHCSAERTVLPLSSQKVRCRDGYVNTPAQGGGIGALVGNRTQICGSGGHRSIRYTTSAYLLYLLFRVGRRGIPGAISEGMYGARRSVCVRGQSAAAYRPSSRSRRPSQHSPPAFRFLPTDIYFTRFCAVCQGKSARVRTNAALFCFPSRSVGVYCVLSRSSARAANCPRDCG